MPTYYRVTVHRNGNAYIVDDDGNRLSLESSKRIGRQITRTAETPIFVYLADSVSGKPEYKIGMSNDPARRAKQLDAEIIHCFKCDAWGKYSARRIETSLKCLYTFAGLHIRGEWFALEDCDIKLFKRWFGDGKELTPSQQML